jgi:hypothetical protein
MKKICSERTLSIALADLKTEEAGLSYEQRRIERGTEQGLIKFEIIRM